MIKMQQRAAQHVYPDGVSRAAGGNDSISGGSGH
jgi:hypothetical protein